ncbi:MAG: hypothetical protein F4211_02645, partial [Acidimicrobiia bacterium]|nr:hypothetical protein [Acidimicrobiia bacterium]
MSPSDDSRAEGAETISITGAAGDLTLTVAGTSVTIEDDDTTPTAIRLSVDADTETAGTQTSVAEDGGKKTVRVTATVDGASTFNSDTTITVAVGENTDSATEGTDYATVGDLTVTISAGQRSGSADFELTPDDDSLDEDTESLSISGSSSTKVTFTDTSVDISDNDSPPTVTISDASATEGTAVSFTVSLDAASGKEVKVKWATATDSSPGAVQATADTDYTAQALTEITISAGSTSTTVTVDTADDVIDEPAETFKVQLSEATNAVISSSAASAVGTITDNDGAPSSITLSVDADTATAGTQSSVAEDGGAKTARVTATVDGSTRFNADTTVTVAVGAVGDSAIEGTDYTTVGALTVTISAGDASGYVDFTLSPTDDSLDEDDETLSITGTSEGLTVNAASVSIDDDDDPPTVSVTGGSATEGSAVEFMVTLDAASGRDVKVKWATADDGSEGAVQATADTDYTAQTATEITITAGVTTKTVTVATLGDVIDEPAETFLVQLSDATNAKLSSSAGSAVGTISDDDATPTGITLSVDADTGTDEVQSGVAEEGGAKTARITATVDGDTTFSSATTVTVQVGANTDSATEGVDYATVADLTITIPVGEGSASADFSLSPSDDSRAEGAETI